MQVSRTQGLSAAVAGQWEHVRRRANGAPMVLAVNAILMTGAWFLLPRYWLFAWTGPTAYALSLSTWLYSDVLSTNVLGGDAPSAIGALDNPRALKEFLRARTVVLWCFVAPVCAAIAVAIGFEVRHWLYTLATVVVVMILPLGALPICEIVGIIFPYHPRPLRWRWQHRRQFRHMIARWAALVLVPYWVYPLCCLAVAALPRLIWAHAARGDDVTSSLVERAVGCILIAATLAVSLGYLGYQIAAWLAMRRREALVAYLSEPERG